MARGAAPTLAFSTNGNGAEKVTAG
jgi:hypothetical protein